MDYEDLDKKLEIIIEKFRQSEEELTIEESSVFEWLKEVQTYLLNKEKLEKKFNRLFR